MFPLPASSCARLRAQPWLRRDFVASGAALVFMQAVASTDGGHSTTRPWAMAMRMAASHGVGLTHGRVDANGPRAGLHSSSPTAFGAPVPRLSSTPSLPAPSPIAAAPTHPHPLSLHIIMLHDGSVRARQRPPAWGRSGRQMPWRARARARRCTASAPPTACIALAKHPDAVNHKSFDRLRSIDRDFGFRHLLLSKNPHHCLGPKREPAVAGSAWH